MRKVVDIINIIAAVIFGVMLASLPWKADAVSAQVLTAKTGFLAGVVLVVGLVIVVLNLAQAFREFRAGTFRRDLEITTEEGANRVNIHALERQLLAELTRQADISDASVILDAHGEGHPIACNLQFKLKRQDDVMKRVDTLKKAVRDTFLRIIPSGVGIEITATITDLVDATAPQASSGASASPAFSGPDFSGYEGESEMDEVQG